MSKPHQILGIPETQLSNFQKVKKAFRQKMLISGKIKADRIKLNLAFQRTCDKIFKSTENSFVISILEGNRQKVISTIINDKQALNKRIWQYPPIYYAVRSGNEDVVQFLLKAGCKIQFQGHRSSPMHCAAFYGLQNIIPLLVEYGMPIKIKNFIGNIPLDEAATDQIKKVLKKTEENKIHIFEEKIFQQKLGYQVINIKDNGLIVIKKVILENYYRNFDDYTNAFHGTSYESLHSIAKYGLKKPGDLVDGKKLKIVGGHIPTKVQHRGKKDWAGAVFASPSVRYSGHSVYSKQFSIDNTQWHPIVQVKVKPDSCQSFRHTLSDYKSLGGQPELLEYRIQTDTETETSDCGAGQECIVVAIMFVLKKFLEVNDYYKALSELIVSSYEERNFRNYHQFDQF